MVARTFKGRIWLMMRFLWIRKTTQNAPGCVQVKAGLCNAHEVVMVSYWENMAALKSFFTSTGHKKMMQYFHRHPSHLSLYNEMYRPHASGKYAHEANGLARLYARAALRDQT